jgi:hypothetical protein
MFGVVARMLECSFCQPESRKLLQTEGFDEKEADACLTSLSSPKLDATEAAILKPGIRGIYHVGDEQPVTLQKFLDGLR